MKLEETRVLRDPIHGYIHIQESVIWNLLDTPEFQRLRRIRQLGGNFQVYHAAEHTRFTHSLGVYEIFRRILQEVPGVSDSLSPLEQKAGLCAALLHDIGHGPFSHCYERIAGVFHEDISRAIILDPSTGVHQALVREDPALPALAASILDHTCGNQLLSDLISSQLDCDRMDYLLRDAYETGTSYGSFDLERILRTMRVADGRLCVKKSGMHSIEDYIMSRYQMYWQVYLHPDAAGYEILISAFFDRYRKVRGDHPIELLEPVCDAVFDLQRYLTLDDFSLTTGIAQAQKHPDATLADLAGRIVSRRLFGWEKVKSQTQVEAILNTMIGLGYDPADYFHIRTVRLDEYLPYKEEGSRPIVLLDEDDSLKLLSDCSVVAASLLGMKETESTWIYHPKF